MRLFSCWHPRLSGKLATSNGRTEQHVEEDNAGAIYSLFSVAPADAEVAALHAHPAAASENRGSGPQTPKQPPKTRAKACKSTQFTAPTTSAIDLYQAVSGDSNMHHSTALTTGTALTC